MLGGDDQEISTICYLSQRNGDVESFDGGNGSVFDFAEVTKDTVSHFFSFGKVLWGDYILAEG